MPWCVTAAGAGWLDVNRVKSSFRRYEQAGSETTKEVLWRPNLEKPKSIRRVCASPAGKTALPLSVWAKLVRPCHASNVACTSRAVWAASVVLLVAWPFSATIASHRSLSERLLIGGVTSPPPPLVQTSRRKAGNKMTSRILGLSVSNIIKRSMPIPHPPVGGMPYSSARTKSWSKNMASSSPLSFAATWA